MVYIIATICITFIILIFSKSEKKDMSDYIVLISLSITLFCCGYLFSIKSNDFYRVIIKLNRNIGYYEANVNDEIHYFKRVTGEEINKIEKIKSNLEKNKTNMFKESINAK